MWVLIFHVNELSERYLGYHTHLGIVEAGHVGVDFFFVLSGFIICLIHWRDMGVPTAVRTYFLKRFARIYPLVFIVNTVKLAFMAVVGRGMTADKLSINSIVGSYFLLPDTKFWIHDVTWTLAYEMWFYLSFGLLLLLGRRIMLFVGGVYAFGIIGLQAIGTSPLSGLPGFVFNARVLEFMMGMAVASFVTRRVQVPFKAAGALALLAIGLIAGGCALRWDQRLEGLLRSLFWGPTFALLLFSMLQIETRFSFARLKLLLFAGDASYSIYLFHGMALHIGFLVLRKVLVGSSSATLFLSCVMLAILALGSSMLFYRVAEAPIQNYFRDRFRRVQAA